ncbi:hypothetical protein HPB47_021601 [Ixodes persulcatus]|uniref:Uncharacterized protein n=1 Tax=Ixodes persulcatus TaxID=34615 RepID=A0AC60QC50_IXOPE|nr:hypothetical protein HPB47_021601 [Ixodes persulcatus]
MPGNKTCTDGLLLPFLDESSWSREGRSFVYLLGLLYCFLGVAIIADVFMCAIEKITSKTRRITLSAQVPGAQPDVIEVKVWNETVANLTLMALGSSAPEILLAIIEIMGNKMPGNKTCTDGLLLPFLDESSWSREGRSFVYLLGLLYCFLGVAIIADVFMCAIEKITSKTRRITLSAQVPGAQPDVIEVKVWNETVANLTLMALGSSAPEILLAIIEIMGNKSSESRPSSASCLLVASDSAAGFSPHVVELWEAILTLLFFPLLVFLAYAADRGIFWPTRRGRSAQKQLELQTTTDTSARNGNAVAPASGPGTRKQFFPNGELNRESLLDFIREIRKHPGLTDEDAACLASAQLAEQQRHTRMWYRVGAIRDLTGGRRTKPSISEKLQHVRNTCLHQNIFQMVSLKKIKKIGKSELKWLRKYSQCEVLDRRVETIDGTAVAGEDYMDLRQMVLFQPGEVQRKVSVQIVDDNQWEPDETFFLRLSLPLESSNVMLGRKSVMEVTIIDDDEPGTFEFRRRGLLVRESVGSAQVAVVRSKGADGTAFVHWRTKSQTAKEGEDFHGGEGKLVFEHGETVKNIEIPIVDDFENEKDEHFEVELFDPSPGSSLGHLTKTTVTITSDEGNGCHSSIRELQTFDCRGKTFCFYVATIFAPRSIPAEFNTIVNRLMLMTNTNVDKLRLHSETWVEQMKDAMNVNGGDIESATAVDYVMHFLTFGWKVIFALVPPTGFLGGWLTFFVSLGAIGLLTAIVGDLAGIFGCLVGLEDTITAITFVALGTSLPDLFASKGCARSEKYADNAIGNVTGSNSVNVFLGLGIPWVVAAAYWQIKGGVFDVDAGSLGFSVGIYCAVSASCIALLVLRRHLNFFGKGELGGPRATSMASAVFLVFLWVLYIVLSALKTYKKI